MRSILLPIKREFVERILSGEKRYEYRKKLCREEIEKIYIYETAPTKKVVAEVNVIGKITNTKEKVWRDTKEYSGISKEFFDQYFSKEIASAYCLGEVTAYDNPKELKDFGISYYPQSYVYIG